MATGLPNIFLKRFVGLGVNSVLLTPSTRNFHFGAPNMSLQPGKLQVSEHLPG